MLHFFKDIPRTFFVLSFYAELITRGKGIGIGFMLVQVFLTLAVPSLSVIPYMSTAQLAIDNVFDQFPVVTLKSYKLSIDCPSPYTVDLFPDGKKRSSIVFDTDAHEMNVADVEREMADKGSVALVTSDYIALRKSSSIELHNYSEYQTAKSNLVINHEQWVEIGKKLLVYGLPVALFLGMLGCIIATLIVNFFKAVIIKFVALFFTVKPDCSAAMRLSAAAAVPVG
jgi:hypothetical protein